MVTWSPTQDHDHGKTHPEALGQDCWMAHLDIAHEQEVCRG